MKRILVSATVALAVGAAVPAVATAHDAVVSCVNGDLTVVPDYQHLNPTWQVVGTNVIINWSDGFTRTKPLPPSCEAMPTPAPVPSVPEEVPPAPAVVVPVVVPPPTCAELLARYPKAGPVRRANWGCPVPVVKLPPKPDKPPKKKRYPRVITCNWILAHYKGTARANMTRKHDFKYCGRPYSPPVAG